MDYFELLKDHIQEKAEIMERLCNREDFWVKYLRRFKDEDDSFRWVQRAVKSGDASEIIDSLHMFKGVVLNLGFSKMSELTKELLASARAGIFDAAAFAQLEREYDAVIAKLVLAEKYENGKDGFFASGRRSNGVC